MLISRLQGIRDDRVETDFAWDPDSNPFEYNRRSSYFGPAAMREAATPRGLPKMNISGIGEAPPFDVYDVHDLPAAAPATAAPKTHWLLWSGIALMGLLLMRSNRTL